MPGTPTVSVVCNNNLTVTITIMGVTDLAAFNVGDWRIDNKNECEPSFSGQTVAYTNLPVPTCASTSRERTDKSDILYLFQIRALVPGNGPTQAMDYVFNAYCAYGSIYKLTVSYELIPNHGGNDSGTNYNQLNRIVCKDSTAKAKLPYLRCAHSCKWV